MELIKAIDGQDLAEVKRILTEDPNLVNERDQEGVPVLLHAAGTSSFEVLAWLVEYSRASLDLRDENLRDALHHAVLSGDPEKVRYLVERCGMNPAAGDRRLVTPYQLAYEKSREAGAASGYSEILNFFAEKLGAPYEEMYHNPIRTGCFPDPSIVRVGEDYYMVNSSFIYFPCIPISHSRDLVHWEIIGHAITNPEWAGLDELEGGRGYWAPDISYDDGTFYITATYRMNDTGSVIRRQIVVTSDRPEGPYSQPAFIDEDGIDPSLFHEDGRHYMLLNRGARILELSSDCKKQISEAKLLYYGHQKHAPEGPHILKKDGYYYLFQAEGGTGIGHRISVARSRELMGIYEPCPYNPILRQTDPEAALQRCGHGKPVSTPDGRWYMVYLCGRMLEHSFSILGRETALDPITWTADGWPLVNGLQGPGVLQKMPLPAWMPEVGTGLDFVTPRPPQMGAVVHIGEDISLLSSPEPLSSVDARNIYLRRQTAFDFDMSVRMETADLPEDGAAGITGYYDENTWVVFGLKRMEDRYALQVVEHIGDEDVMHPALELETLPGAVLLEMETRGLSRTFRGYDADGKLLQEETLDKVYYLCDEGLRRGKRFTGAMAGLYAHGGKKQFRTRFRELRFRDL